MKTRILSYRKNFTLIASFVVLISSLLIIALYVSYKLTKKVVENEFSAAKVDVLEKTVLPYNVFFQNKVSEISFYQGFLDSTSATQYANSVLNKYPFVERILFYDAQISNRDVEDGLRTLNFSLGIKGLYQYGLNVNKDSTVLFSADKPGSLSLSNGDEFNKIGLKLASYLSNVDTTKLLSNDQIFNIFYNISHNKITYMNVLRREDIKVYKDLMFKKMPPSPFYEQDIFSFELNPYKLVVKNTYPQLYQNVVIKPLSFETISDKPNLVTTEIALPLAFSNFKLYLSSDRKFLDKEIRRRFLPVGLGIFAVYGILLILIFLISRNLKVNQKLFSLQYDFINNFTHEFKTPVAVIKIAGNNILNAKDLSDLERKRYGKILDEEADKLNDLMNKLLSFTQIENRSIKVKNEEINVEVFSQNIIDAFQLKHPEYDIQLNIKGLTVFQSDPVLLSSIFYNLIENAYKYANADNKFLKISIVKDKKNIVFSFEDKGIGIDASELVHIFKKFYRIQSRYNQQGSVGLGLAFCKELVTFMNGEIHVKSKPGKGSVFVVTLPLDK
ncbi:sensor histidine kinase [Pedobacter arcticus]|uniref:sensor histidine kinase n=1 Tax=Pedobacter arcticus TaxID=752140 RepID=UPI0003015374|nr:HAMP domain-containing sensor histidine kinase [Pedobacter arcticus]